MSGYRAVNRLKLRACSESFSLQKSIPIWDASFLPNECYCVCGADGVLYISHINELDCPPLNIQDCSNLDKDVTLENFNENRLFLGEKSSGILSGSSRFCVSQDPNGSYSIYSISFDGILRTWNNIDNLFCKNEIDDIVTPASTLFIPNASGTNVKLLQTTPPLIAVGCRDGGVSLFFPEDNVLTHHDPFLESSTIACLACHKSLLLAIGRMDGTVDIVKKKVQNGQYSLFPMHRFLYHGGTVRGVAFSHDGALVFSGSDDGSINIYDTISGGLVGSFFGHDGWVLNIAACPLGRRFATSSSDSSVKIWDLSTRQNLHTFDDNHSSPIWALSFSANGKQLISADENGVTQIYSVEG